MYIDTNFKAMLSNISLVIKSKYGIEGDKLSSIPNEKIAGIFKQMIQQSDLKYRTILYEDGTKEELSNFAMRNIKSIDDEFIRVDNKILRYEGFDVLINNTMRLEEQLFKEGDVLKVRKGIELNRMGNSMGQFSSLAGGFYECVGYVLNGDTSTTSSRFSGLGVYVKDAFENLYRFPQAIFEITKHKDVKKLYWQKVKRRLTEELMDTKRLSLSEATSEYQLKLREFMNSARKLHEMSSENIEQKVSEIIDNSMNFSKKMQKFKQVKFASYPGSNIIMVRTNMLYSEQDKSMPIGRYEILLNTQTFSLKIMNIDIGNNRENQHMHIDDNGQCCLGDWITPLRKSYESHDYVSFIIGVIDYLEHYNEGSPYIRRQEFISRHMNKFIDVIKIEKEEEDSEKEKNKKEKEEDKQSKKVSEDIVEEKKEKEKIPSVIIPITYGGSISRTSTSVDRYRLN